MPALSEGNQKVAIDTRGKKRRYSNREPIPNATRNRSNSEKLSFTFFRVKKTFIITYPPRKVRNRGYKSGLVTICHRSIIFMVLRLLLPKITLLVKPLFIVARQKKQLSMI